MKLKEKSEKTGLKLNIQKTKIMASSPITSWGNNGNSDRLYFLGLQYHCGQWLQPWNQTMLALWKKSNDKPRQCIKKQRHHNLPTKVCIVKAMVSPVVMYGCESWTTKRKKAECQRIDAFELWCWRRLLKVPWRARRSN